MKKKITLDNRAEMIQREFHAIREEMATKLDIGELKKEIREIRETMATREDIRNLARSWAEEIVRLEDDIKKLQARVDALETGRRRTRAV